MGTFSNVTKLVTSASQRETGPREGEIATEGRIPAAAAAAAAIQPEQMRIKI
jgi:hypothetical protein